ncbi:MAG: DegT/DnrJ/EryC1/StrS family aminotransferase [bacterium]
MIKKSELNLKELGEKAKIIPGPEPELVITAKRIPISESKSWGKIIPVCEPVLQGKESEYLKKCVETNWISSAGKYIEDFEKEFSRLCGAKYGISTTSGTTALHLALATLGIGSGDEVIIPTFTMIATANVVTHLGAKPVLIDAESKTWNIDTEKIEKKITKKTRAIIPVHIYGHPVEMDKIMELAKKYNLYVVEDAAEAHGAEYRGRKIGSIGDCACFSFYANKIITTGEGGMIVTNNKEIAEKAENLRDHAFSEERHFWHKYVAFNYRMTNLQAAIGAAQVERFSQLVEARIKNARLYNSYLKDVPGITLPPETEGIKNVYWMYSILVEDEFGMTRDELRTYLAKRGIETRTFFIPMHLQPVYYKQYKGEEYPVSEELCRKGMYLPSSSGLEKDEIKFIAESIHDAKAGKIL